MGMRNVEFSFFSYFFFESLRIIFLHNQIKRCHNLNPLREEECNRCGEAKGRIFVEPSRKEKEMMEMENASESLRKDVEEMETGHTHRERERSGERGRERRRSRSRERRRERSRDRGRRRDRSRSRERDRRRR